MALMSSSPMSELSKESLLRLRRREAASVCVQTLDTPSAPEVQSGDRMSMLRPLSRFRAARTSSKPGVCSPMGPEPLSLDPTGAAAAEPPALDSEMLKPDPVSPESAWADPNVLEPPKLEAMAPESPRLDPIGPDWPP